jgi:hypothetical protein
MFRNFTLITILVLALSIVPASGALTNQNSTLTIEPEDCRVLAGQELSLELGGSVPSNAVVTWNVDYGTVASVLPGTSAVLVAPATPSVVTVYVTITGTKPGRWIYMTKQCIVSSADSISG